MSIRSPIVPISSPTINVNTMPSSAHDKVVLKVFCALMPNKIEIPKTSRAEALAIFLAMVVARASRPWPSF